MALKCAPGLRVAADQSCKWSCTRACGRIKAINAHCPTRFAILHLIPTSVMDRSARISYSTELQEQLFYEYIYIQLITSVN